MVGGIASLVLNAEIKINDGQCLVSWSPPHPFSSDVITRYKIRIKSSFAYTPPNTVTLSDVITFVDASVLSYLIPKLPNRKYTAYIQAETCTDVGKETMTAGECVTDASAPESIMQPQFQDKIFDIEDGRLKIYIPPPDEKNGLISCIFIIVYSEHHAEEGDTENLLRELSAENPTPSFGYIAIAADREFFQNHRIQQNDAEILLLTLGDESKTQCDIKNVADDEPRNIDDNSTGVFRGHNKRLKKDDQYRVQVITSTPSGSQVLFQASKELKLHVTPEQFIDSSRVTLISVSVVILVASLLLVLYAFSIRRRRNWKFKDAPLPNEVSRSQAALERSVIAAVSNETEDIQESIGNETTDNKIEKSGVAKPAIPCKKTEPVETEPDDLYENYVSETTVEMSALEQYFKKHTERNNELFFQQYQNIKTKSRENMKSTEVASHPDLKTKNRYKNILPFDSTRVLIAGNDTGYINACYIDGFKHQRKYIATQGPLSSTAVDFWLMVIEQKCKMIVMVAKCAEGGKRKCYKYWPDLNASLTFGSNTVENVDELKFCGFIRRTFRIDANDGSQAIEVIQYQYFSWPDHGVPVTTSNLIRMQKAVMNTLKETRNSSPIIVHCSAGAGRSGTYIAHDILLEEAENFNKIDLFGCVMKMRSQRVEMIQTCDQYILLHKLMLESYMFGDTDFPAHEVQAYFQELIRERKVLSSDFEMLARLIYVETTETNLRNRTEMLEDEHYRLERNALFIPPEHGEIEPPRIEAFWIEAYDESSLMIATRDPTEYTAQYFWRGILYNKANTIIMLSANQECFQYWPSSVGDAIKIGSVTVTLLEEHKDGAIIERTFKVCGEYEEMTVTQFQCTDWNARVCPKDGRSVLRLVEAMTMKTRENSGYASLIHCSDGVGRTGAFCTIVNLIYRLKYENRVDVFSAVKDLRDCKRGMVQTLAQYVFCHQVIIDYLKSFELYSNFG